MRQAAKWINFYDGDAILAWPLRGLSDSSPNVRTKYTDLVSADVEVDVCVPAMAATPFSHSAYWTDDDFTKPVAALRHRLYVAT